MAVGGGIAVVGDGLTLTAFALGNGRQLWQTTLSGPAGGSIMSVRAWPGAVTAGILAASGRSRTEEVVAAASGMELRHYPAAVFGGAVAASLATTVVVGRHGVTSYDNKSGHVRWYHATGQNQSWRVDGTTLYVAESAGGYLGSSPVTALQVINLKSGAERPLSSPLGQPFSGTLAVAVDGVALFASASGVTAYSGSTGGEAVVEGGVGARGDRPGAGPGLPDVGGSTLTGVDPLTGQVKTSVSGAGANGAASMYVVRGGVALGLDAARTATPGRMTWRPGGSPGHRRRCRGRIISPTCPVSAAAPPFPATVTWSSRRLPAACLLGPACAPTLSWSALRFSRIGQAN